MTAQVTIESRFCGPPDSGNGGYVSGTVAGFLAPGPAEVTLRLPPPLERPLRIEVGDADTVTMHDGEALVAEAETIDGFELEIPDPVGVEAAEEARRGSRLHHRHPFPGCFVCGPQRWPGDGLGLVCGAIDSALVAAPWQVDDSLPSENGAVATEIVWAALDCPGGLAGMVVPDVGTCVLGRLAARIHHPIRTGATYVAIGWPIDHEGRKVHAGSAIFSAEGELLADARATWIELKS